MDDQSFVDQCDQEFKKLAEIYRGLGIRAFLTRDQLGDPQLLPAVVGPVSEDTPDVLRKGASTVERYLRNKQH